MKPALRVLNLEDNENDAELSNAMLSAHWPQCHFVRVDNRADFLTALGESGIDLILCDYTIPGFDGMQALTLAREKRPEVPFIFVSGTIGEDMAIEALKSGATDYVLKHRLARLAPSVMRALAEAQEHAERQRAEEAMRESEYKYRKVFESLSDAAFLADEQGGKIIDTNRQAEILLHCQRGDILGRKESQFLVLANMQPGTDDSVECELVRADGATVHVDMRTTHLKLYGRPLVLRLCHQHHQH